MAAIKKDNAKTKKLMTGGAVAGGVWAVVDQEADNADSGAAAEAMEAAAGQAEAAGMASEAAAGQAEAAGMAEGEAAGMAEGEAAQMAEGEAAGMAEGEAAGMAEDEATGQAEGLAGDADVEAETPEEPEAPEVDTSCIKDAVVGLLSMYSKASEKIKILFTYVQMMSSFPGEDVPPTSPTAPT